MALGFDKGDAGLVPNGGKKIGDHLRDITTRLFTGPDRVGDFEESEIPSLIGVVKNRIAS